MTHVLIPLLVVGILDSGSTSPVINYCFVSVSVEDVDVSEPSTHFDRVISSTAICALFSITGSLWTRVGANALGAILQACIVIASRGTVSHTPRRTVPFRKSLLRFIPKELAYQSGVLFLKLLNSPSMSSLSKSL